MDADRIELTVPYLPARDVSGNTRANHFAQYRTRQVMKKDVRMLVASEAGKRSRAGLPRWQCAERVRVKFTFILKDYRRRDEDNLITGTKAFKDGLVEARIVVDDDLKHLVAEYGCEVDAARGPATVIEIERAEPSMVDTERRGD